MVKGAILFMIGLSVVFFIRTVVNSNLDNSFTYKSISGVDFTHIRENLFENQSIWVPQVLFTVGIMMPFYVLSWKSSRKELRNLVLFLLPILFISSTVFSWLYEARNFIPVFVPMAIIAANDWGGEGRNSHMK